MNNVMQFVSCPERGYLIVYSVSQSGWALTRHRFCGTHSIRGAICPNCEQPLLQYAAFDTTDPRLHLSEISIRYLRLFYCWRCNLGAQPFVYRCGEEHIEILYAYQDTDIFPPYEDYPAAFPEAALFLLPLPESIQVLWRLWNRGFLSWEPLPLGVEHEGDWSLWRAIHGVGGEPWLVQRNPHTIVPSCVSCGSKMPFFAAFGDDNTDPRGFTGEPTVQVLYFVCRACQIVHAVNQCD